MDLHWQALHTLGTNYTVFVHLVGGYNPATGGPIWAQDACGTCSSPPECGRC